MKWNEIFKEEKNDNEVTRKGSVTMWCSFWFFGGWRLKKKRKQFEDKNDWIEWIIGFEPKKIALSISIYDFDHTFCSQIITILWTLTKYTKEKKTKKFL